MLNEHNRPFQLAQWNARTHAKEGRIVLMHLGGHMVATCATNTYGEVMVRKGPRQKSGIVWVPPGCKWRVELGN